MVVNSEFFWSLSGKPGEFLCQWQTQDGRQYSLSFTATFEEKRLREFVSRLNDSNISPQVVSDAIVYDYGDCMKSELTNLSKLKW